MSVTSPSILNHFLTVSFPIGEQTKCKVLVSCVFDQFDSVIILKKTFIHSLFVVFKDTVVRFVNDEVMTNF